MKKTLIALMALSSTAFALNSTELTTAISEKLTERNYVKGHTVSITLEGLSGSLKITTGTDLKFDSQSNGGTQFINIAETGTSNYSWADKSLYTITGHNTMNPVASLTLTAEEAKAGYWLTPAIKKATTGEFTIDNGQTNEGVYSMSLVYNDGDDFTTLSFVRTSTGTSFEKFVTNVTIQGWTFDAKDIQITSGAASSVTVKVIPEPATATLSLLALAGLAARRRRR